VDRRADQRRLLELQDEYRDDRDTRERLKAEIEDSKRAIDEQLREHCRR
jgi:hypothetical protein